MARIRKPAPPEELERRPDVPEESIEEEVEHDFAERQRLALEGREGLRRKLREHTSESPDLTAGDLDAAWDYSKVGEELVGGSVPTPDQDIVDEIGEAAGLTYEDDEPLNYNKVLERDRDRWELNPASAGGAQARKDEDDSWDAEEDLDELVEELDIEDEDEA